MCTLSPFSHPFLLRLRDSFLLNMFQLPKFRVFQPLLYHMHNVTVRLNKGHHILSSYACPCLFVHFVVMSSCAAIVWQGATDDSLIQLGSEQVLTRLGDCWVFA